MVDTNAHTNAVHPRRKRHRNYVCKVRFPLLTICLGLLISAACFAVCAVRTEAVPAASLEPAEPPAPSAPLPENAGRASPEDWQLLLVNRWNPIPDGYTCELTQLKQGHAVDARAYPDLQAMLDACRAAGLEPLICSSYRTQAKQRELYENKIQRLMDEGYSYEHAVEEAGTVVAVPGTSEHQTGLALDIVDASYQHLDQAQEATPVQQWLMAHSWEYGFVLRYPTGKSETTGIIYEPWHYRYVGREAAREMRSLGLCLEEYVDRFSAQ